MHLFNEVLGLIVGAYLALTFRNERSKMETFLMIVGMVMIIVSVAKLVMDLS